MYSMGRCTVDVDLALTVNVYVDVDFTEFLKEKIVDFRIIFGRGGGWMRAGIHILFSSKGTVSQDF